MENLGRNIKRICNEKGIIQKELAITAGISQRVVSDAINESQKVTKKTIRLISVALGVTEEELLKDSEKEEKIDRAKIAENVKLLCKLEGILQRELADRAGVSISTVYKVVSNRGELRSFTLVQIAKALGVSLKELSSNNYLVDERFGI